MATYDKFIPNYCDAIKPKNFQKIFEIRVKKSQYCPKIPEIDLDFLDFLDLKINCPNLIIKS